MSNQFEQPENYRNRELSWLEFDYRVLSEARDKSLPLFERLKFLSITASNLDEFFYDPCGFIEGHGSCGVYKTGHSRHEAPGAAEAHQQKDT